MDGKVEIVERVEEEEGGEWVNFFFHVIQDSMVFFMASRAYGMYDKEYHIIASDWIIINRRAKPGLCNCKQKCYMYTLRSTLPIKEQ